MRQQREESTTNQDPACLVLTADTDDRVVPTHAKKFVATLQAFSSGEAPLLLPVE